MIVRTEGVKLKMPMVTAKKKQDIRPAWQRRMELRIEDLRRKLGRLLQYKNRNRSKRVVNKVNQILEDDKMKTHSKYEENKKIEEYCDKIKQKIAAYSERLRRCKLSSKRREDNCIYSQNYYQHCENYHDIEIFTIK